jgi:LmbE family N-acetylglucosaminyl deacetylase
VSVCIVTNGDYCCPDKTKGERRLGESLEALKLLGMDESDIYFLGYPDTGFEPEVSFLSDLYKEQDTGRIYPSSCGRETYGTAGKPEFHFSRGGGHAPYSKAAFMEDLNTIILTLAPELVITSSQWDMHGDHAALFCFTRNALLRLPHDKRPMMWESLIHSPAGDKLWPLPDTDVFTCPPGFDERRWSERIRVPLPDDMLTGPAENRLKYRAIQAHRSALKPDEEPEVVRYLLSFAKAEEIFWNVKL